MVYVDNLNIIRTYEKLPKIVEYLKKEFEMKGLKEQSFVLACKSSI